jgi:hypothetical protein
MQPCRRPWDGAHRRHGWGCGLTIVVEVIDAADAFVDGPVGYAGCMGSALAGDQNDRVDDGRGAGREGD